MTIVFTDSSRRRRNKLSASKATNAYPAPAQASHSSMSVHSQTYSPPPLQQQSSYSLSPPPDMPGYYGTSPPPPPAGQPGYYGNSPPIMGIANSPPQYQSAHSPPQQYYPVHSPPQQHHPVYGPTPQVPQNYGSPYGALPFPPPSQPYIGNSTVSVATSPPQKQKEGYLKSHWNRAERMASRSCQDLTASISSSANKSSAMITTYGVDRPTEYLDKTGARLASGANKSATYVTTNYIERPTNLISKKSVQALNQGAALCDRISTKLDAVITSIDGGVFSGKEQDLMVEEDQMSYQSTSTLHPGHPQDRSIANVYSSNINTTKSSNMFSKVWLYANSRLPPHLPPFKVYMPTYPLLCLAASYSERVYTPSIHESEAHVPADWRSGTKAMVLKSLPIDDMNTVVFAIRGSQTFMDWAVNYRSEPTSPEGFLDDPGNLCHAGFLYVARKMVKPVADRLRVLLEENPSRSNCSLLITGHSAGGAVAALLYAHMLALQTQSELSHLTSFFKRVHCITFGAPPVSLLPLQKPDVARHRKSLFYSFINEGDPVPRADKAVVKSLLKLYSSPAPSANESCVASLATSVSKLNLVASNTSQATLLPPSSPPIKKSRKFAKPSKTSLKSNNTATTTSTTVSTSAIWPIVPCALSPAGRLVVLRERHGGMSGVGAGGREEEIEAVTVDDGVLREVVYGDPLKHMMKVYRKRVEAIATRAVTASEF